MGLLRWAFPVILSFWVTVPVTVPTSSLRVDTVLWTDLVLGSCIYYVLGRCILGCAVLTEDACERKLREKLLWFFHQTTFQQLFLNKSVWARDWVWMLFQKLRYGINNTYVFKKILNPNLNLYPPELTGNSVMVFLNPSPALSPFYSRLSKSLWSLMQSNTSLVYTSHLVPLKHPLSVSSMIFVVPWLCCVHAKLGN